MGFGTYKNQEPLSQFIENLRVVCSNNEYEFIDTARFYKNEKKIGSALQKLKKEFSFHILVQSKVWPKNFTNVKTELKKSLKDLQLTKIDSYLLHRPHWDMKINILAWKQLIKCQQAGLVEEIGVSNFDKEMIDILFKHSGVYPKINQIELSVANMRWDRVLYNQQKKIIIQSWRPLTNDQKIFLNHPVVVKIAKTHKIDSALILIAFLKNLALCPIIKSQNNSRIESNAKAYHVKLSSKEIEQLKALNIYLSGSSSTFDLL